MALQYLNTGDVVQLIESFLGVFAQGLADAGTAGKFVDSQYDNKHALLGGSISGLSVWLG